MTLRHARRRVRVSSPKLLSREECDQALILLEQGRVHIVKEFGNGNPRLFLVSPAGVMIGSPPKNQAYLFERYLSLNGNNDGLFEGFSQTAGKDQ